MPYCPNCGYEYQEGIEKCGECGQALVDKLPEDQPWVEIFRCADRASAERICDVVLTNIPTLIHSRGSRAFPTASLNLGQEFIAVEEPQAANARQLLTEAIQDGVIGPEEGELLPMEEET